MMTHSELFRIVQAKFASLIQKKIDYRPALSLSLSLSSIVRRSSKLFLPSCGGGDGCISRVRWTAEANCASQRWSGNCSGRYASRRPEHIDDPRINCP